MTATPRHPFRKADYTRIVKAARDLGLGIAGTEVRPDGTIYLDHRDTKAEDDGMSLLDDLIEQGAKRGKSHAKT